MTKYLYTYEKQKKVDGRFYTQEIENEYTVDSSHLENATSPETMRFFRRGLGSKQEIRRSYLKDGREVIKVFSYNPVKNDERVMHKYVEIKD